MYFIYEQGSLGDTLKEVRPHAFFGVPRVWEKMQEKMQSSARNITGLKKKMAVWAKNIGLRGNYNLMKGYVSFLCNHLDISIFFNFFALHFFIKF